MVAGRTNNRLWAMVSTFMICNRGWVALGFQLQRCHYLSTAQCAAPTITLRAERRGKYTDDKKFKAPKSSVPSTKSKRTFSANTKRSKPPPTFQNLVDPTILFQNHHLLVVNKPAGWHSVPNDHRDFAKEFKDAKCLLTRLKELKLGGGSQSDFLLPMHRVDQPCTGALLLAKNKKAGTRITTAWKNKQVTKEYWCVVQGRLSEMKLRSDKIKGGYSIQGILKKTDTSRSVVVTPLSAYSSSLSKGERVCQLDWKPIRTLPKQGLELIRVQTKTGARHQVRAMLAQLLQSPIAGDLRYGSQNLPDQSVALHARSIYLPTVTLGGTEILQQEPFVAPIPKTWNDFFGVKETDFKKGKP